MTAETDQPEPGADRPAEDRLTAIESMVAALIDLIGLGLAESPADELAARFGRLVDRADRAALARPGAFADGYATTVFAIGDWINRPRA